MNFQYFIIFYVMLFSSQLGAFEYCSGGPKQPCPKRFDDVDIEDVYVDFTDKHAVVLGATAVALSRSEESPKSVRALFDFGNATCAGEEFEAEEELREIELDVLRKNLSKLGLPGTRFRTTGTPRVTVTPASVVGSKRSRLVSAEKATDETTVSRAPNRHLMVGDQSTCDTQTNAGRAKKSRKEY